MSTLASFFVLTLCEEYLFVSVFVDFFYSFANSCKSLKILNAVLLTLGFVMVLKCLVTNDKVDAVEQCHDE